MRVIAGTARRLLLETIPGEDTRPTTDRIKETLFNMLQTSVPGSRFLDLFGGSGAIAIEALSRGAVHATIVEKNPKAVAVIERNLEHTHLAPYATLIRGDAVSAVQQLSLSDEKPFDLIFLDPPYGKGLEDRALAALAESSLLHDETRFILELKMDSEVSRFEALGYHLIRSKEYKSNKHVFLKRG